MDTNHCWHSAGRSVTLSTPAAEYYCCWCRATVWRDSHHLILPTTGHGPHYHETRLKWAPLPQTPCPARQDAPNPPPRGWWDIDPALEAEPLPGGGVALYLRPEGDGD